jgi:hypothetical protein
MGRFFFRCGEARDGVKPYTSARSGGIYVKENEFEGKCN